MLLIILLTTLFSLLIIVNHFKRRKFFQLAKHFKQSSIKSYPFLGVAYLFFGTNISRFDQLRRLGNVASEAKDGMFGEWIGSNFYLCVANPETAEFILKECLERADVAKKLYPFFGNGSLIAPVSIWRHRRKNLVPLFNTKSLNSKLQFMIKNSKVMAEHLKIKTGKATFPMWNYLLAYSMDSIFESTFGIQINSLVNQDHSYLRDFKEGLNLACQRAIQIWFHNDMIYNLLPQSRRFYSASSGVKHFIRETIDNKRKELQIDDDLKERKYDTTFLERLLEVGYDDVELIEELTVLLGAAMDTSAAALGFIMLMMARRQDLQEKVYEELQSVFGDSDRTLNLEGLKRLNYLEIVIKETLRLYSPALLSLRKVTKEVILPSGVTLREGCGVLIHLWAIHRNPKYWGDDADKFRPERFLDTPFKHPAQYMPFGLGPRNCPGYKYGLLSIKTVLATLLRRYRVLPPVDNKPIRCSFQLTVSDEDGFEVQLENRNGNNLIE